LDKKKIKVAHIISRMVSGGAEENTAYTVLGLDKERYSIDLIVGDDFDRSIIEGNDKDSKVNIIQVKGLKGPLNFFYDPIILWKLINLFKNNQYDIVHTHTTKTGILGRIAARFAKVPVIICGLHGSAFGAFNSWILNWALISLEKYTGGFTDAFISVSNILSERYQKEGIGRNSKYYTVLSGMDLEKFYNSKSKVDKKRITRELNIDTDAFIIGNVARLEAVKGHKYLIDAFKIVKEKKKDANIFLLIVGEGEERGKLMEIVHKIGLDKDIIFIGYRNDIEKIMGIMDIIALTSLREGLPRVLVQAAAVGLPSVAFNVDGVPEIVRDEMNGFLVEPKNVNEFSERILRYIDDRNLINVHGKNGQNFVKGKWFIEEMVSQIDNIYQELIQEKIGK
jgi:glycosyltransferase involved in cell wall biosynthesis